VRQARRRQRAQAAKQRRRAQAHPRAPHQRRAASAHEAEQTRARAAALETCGAGTCARYRVIERRSHVLPGPGYAGAVPMAAASLGATPRSNNPWEAPAVRPVHGGLQSVHPCTFSCLPRIIRPSRRFEAAYGKEKRRPAEGSSVDAPLVGNETRDTR
jgi:hypothetical protein